MQAALAGAEELLRKGGLDALTIPTLAEHLGFSRMAIYHFFPSRETILNALTDKALQEFERRVVDEGIAHPERRWKAQIAGMVEVLSRFFVEDPIAQLVILNSGLSAEASKATSLTTRRLGEMTNKLFDDAGLPLPRSPINVVELMVDIGMTVFRASAQLHGHITPRFQQEITTTMVGYLEPYVHAAKAIQADGRRPAPLTAVQSR